MKKIVIINGVNIVTLKIAKSEIEAFIRGLNNCLTNPLEYSKILYEYKGNVLMFTAEYLKQSIISFPKEYLEPNLHHLILKK
ncbi:hypothetical protein [Flavobacterium sp. J27]|uniref:hypothetical protein n=1 Tax=Flavobacterium sp. J27 TaxID=2060419 RepID=UPI00102F6624|nr:hypothetical protein [Flavobacterium sp. J27]